MANIKRKSMSDIRGAAIMGGGRGYEKAARDYVNSGLKELIILQKKLEKLVAQLPE